MGGAGDHIGTGIDKALEPNLFHCYVSLWCGVWNRTCRVVERGVTPVKRKYLQRVILIYPSLYADKSSLCNVQVTIAVRTQHNFSRLSRAGTLLFQSLLLNC